MPTEEVTIKINTVMGSTKGVDDVARHVKNAAGSAAVQAGGVVVDNARAALETQVKELQSKLFGGKGGGARGGSSGMFGSYTGAGGMLSQGLQGSMQGLASGNLLGMLGRFAAPLALLGAQANVMQGMGGTMAMTSMNLDGGMGLRGQGIYGKLKGWQDWANNRDTYESGMDFRLQQGEFQRGLFSQKLGLDVEKAQRRINVDPRFNPITEANQFEAARDRRAMLAQKQAEIRRQDKMAGEKMGGYEAAMNQAAFMNVGMVGPLWKLEENRTRVERLKQREQFQAMDEGVAEERKQFEFQQLGQKKATVQSARQQWGGMLPVQRAQTMSIISRMKAGQQVSPEEVSQIEGLGIANETVMEWRNKQAEQGAFGFNKMASEIGDPTFSKAAKAAIKFDGKIEHYLDEAIVADQMAKMRQDLEEAGNDMKDRLLKTMQDAAKGANDWAVGKQLITNFILEGVGGGGGPR